MGASSSNFVFDTQTYVLKERITLHFKCHIFTFAGLYNWMKHVQNFQRRFFCPRK